MNRFSVWLLTVSILLMTQLGCIDPIEFTGPDADFNLVVTGVITNSPGQRTISLSYQQPIDIFQNRDTIPPDASINLFEDGALIAAFSQISSQKYELDDSVLLEEGKSYHIEIQFFNGSKYASVPELVRPAITPDSLTLAFERREIDTNAGTTLRRWFLDVMVNNTIPSTGEKPYFRWAIEEDWEVVELSTDNPFDVQRTCYFNTSPNSLAVTIMDGNEFQAGPVAKAVAARVPGDAYKDRHVFSVYQHQISPEAYTFYERVDRLVNQTGTLFDQLPAAIPGNVSNVNAPEERVLGYVEFSLVDTSRIWIRRTDFPFTIPLTCVDPNASPRLCIECILIPGATYEKPYFWD